jgi:hypothetical protein
MDIIIGLWQDANNYVEFFASDIAGVRPTWHAICCSGGVPTDIDTLVEIPVAASGTFQVLKIEYTDSEVNFSIDDVLVATIDSNIPTGTVEALLELTNNHVGEDRHIEIDSVTIMGER